MMKGAMKFMSTMEEEQEFLEYAANQLINVYAMDSAVARALMAVRQGGVDAHTHELLAQMAVLRLLPRDEGGDGGRADDAPSRARSAARSWRRCAPTWATPEPTSCRCSASWRASSPRRAPIRCRQTSPPSPLSTRRGGHRRRGLPQGVLR